MLRMRDGCSRSGNARGPAEPVHVLPFAPVRSLRNICPVYCAARPGTHRIIFSRCCTVVQRHDAVPKRLIACPPYTDALTHEASDLCQHEADRHCSPHVATVNSYCCCRARRLAALHCGERMFSRCDPRVFRKFAVQQLFGCR